MTLWMLWTLVVSALLALAAAMADRVAARMRIARRFVWIVAALVATVGPAWSALGPADRPDHDRSARSIRTSESLGSAEVRRLTDVAVWQRVNAFAAATRELDVWLVRGWLVASATVLLAVIAGAWQMRLRARGWIAADTEFGRVFVSHDDGPAVFGSLRPAIVVPQWALALERGERNLMLRHEREHLLAHDSRLLLAGALVLMLVPWNAAVWWMLRRLRLAIELDCDARVISAVGNARQYGAMLLAVGERYAARPSLATSLAEAGAHLEARITAMMMPVVQKPVRAALPFALAATVIVVTAAFVPAPPAQRVRQQAGVAQAAEPKPLRGNPSPRYPDDLRESGVEGEILMTFATDARGVPDTATINVLRSSHKSFEAAVRRALPQWRYDSQGHVRFAVRFMGVETEQREARGAARSPDFVVEGAPVMPVIVVAQLDRAPVQRSPGSD